MNPKRMRAGQVLLVAMLLALSAAPDDLEAKKVQDRLGRYTSHVSASVKRNLKISPEWRRRAYETTARIELDQAGRVTGAFITTPSGNAAFDRAVLAAIKKSGAFGPPPFALYALGLRFSSKI